MKRILALLLVLTLSLGILAGCSKDTSGTGDDTGSASKDTVSKNEDTSGKKEEPVELTFIERFGRQWDENGAIYKWLEEKFNIKIKIEHVQEQDGTQSWYSLRIAAGDTPDYVSDVTFSDYVNYVNQGVFAEIPLDDIKTYAPDMVKWYEEEVGPHIWNIYDIDGKNYALPILWSLGTHWNSLAIRKDWLDDVGIDKLPETLEELEYALGKFKEEKGLDYVISGAGINYFSFVGGA